MAVLPHGVSECLSSRVMAGENLQLAAAIIVEPLGPPCPGVWRSSKTLAGSAPGWLVFVIMSRAPKDRKLASLAGLLLGLNLVDGASRMNVEARLAVQRTFAMLLSVGEQMQPCVSASELPGRYLRVPISG
jgi:hypothetical protein